MRGVREAEARLDPDGVEPREDVLRMERSLTMREDGLGMVHLHAHLDPESAAPVLGADSLPLDLGRAARLFTRAQRLALGERDGGCASCGQNIAYVEAHHIAWWERDTAPTDLSNGVMLCSFCHMIHREGWKILASPNDVWFIPPPHIDPAQVPRLGGRARFELREDRAA